MVATKAKKSAPKKQNEQTTVTRIKASEPTKKASKKSVATVSSETKEKKQRKNPFKAIGSYFAGAWHELKQVRWPNRKATWSMTAAMLAFTAFFIVLILLLDALFKYLFEIILG